MSIATLTKELNEVTNTTHHYTVVVDGEVVGTVEGCTGSTKAVRSGPRFWLWAPANPDRLLPGGVTSGTAPTRNEAVKALLAWTPPTHAQQVAWVTARIAQTEESISNWKRDVARGVNPFAADRVAEQEDLLARLTATLDALGPKPWADLIGPDPFMPADARDCMLWPDIDEDVTR